MKRRKGRTVAIVAGAGVLALTLLIGVYWQEIASWVKFVYLFESVGRNEQGYAEYRHRQTGIVFVRVPGGRFLMGSPPRADGIGWPMEEPRHQVALSSFLIAKYEVTQEQWSLVMTEGSPGFEGKNLPVGNVSWIECTDFCRRTGLSLPTEAGAFSQVN